MPSGEGKGWSRGKTAATDPRVARSAAGHQGKTYARRTPIEMGRWPGAARTRAQVEWSRDLAYVAGLIATDGCLIEKRRRIDFVTADLQLMETYLSCLGRPARYRIERTRRGSKIYRSMIHDGVLYSWLLEIGLTPRKSLTLGPVAIPEAHLPHLVRGLLDGDGSIMDSVTAADTTRRPDGSYRYEWFRVRFISASRRHLEWLHGRLVDGAGVRGRIWSSASPSGGCMYRLQFGRWESMRLASWIYAEPDAPCLLRKRSVWTEYASRHARAVALAQKDMSLVARAALARWAREGSAAPLSVSVAPRGDRGSTAAVEPASPRACHHN